MPEEYIEILLMGLDTPHDPDFVFNRPKGMAAYLLTCFTTPFFINTGSGIENGLPGDCILIPPGFPHLHGTAAAIKNEGFRNDWVHLRGEGINDLAAKYNLPFNVIIHTKERYLLTAHLQKIRSEQAQHKLFYKEHIYLLLEEIFLIIGRYCHMKAELEDLTPLERELKEKFVEARKYVHSLYNENWTVARMAGLVNLSENRFAVLYKKFFRISPKDDLILKRIDEAKVRLVNTSQSVSKIALDCGFASQQYFSRIFGRRVGYPPAIYRKETGNQPYQS